MLIKKPMSKPAWIRSQLPSKDKISKVTRSLRDNQLATVCEEANCPNRGECFSSGTATFMIMGNICTRNCGYCNVQHGKPQPLDANEPERLAKTVKKLQLTYVVITSVTRADLADGGANHFAACIKKLRQQTPQVKIEILTPYFRDLDALSKNPPDIFNHNIETVPRLYKKVRPNANYQLSLNLLKEFKNYLPNIPTKSGMMLGLGETDKEIEQVLVDLRAHKIDRLTLGQYLQPSRKHLPVERFVTPQQFEKWAIIAKKMGFKHVASGPMVRSSYHAHILRRAVGEDGGLSFGFLTRQK